MFLSSLYILASGFVAVTSAVSCYQGPQYVYESTTWSDSWNVRGSLCTGGGTCRNAGGGNYSTLICEASSNNVYGGFRAHSEADAQADCYDAFNTIITECVYQSKPGGFIVSGDALFALQPIQVSSS